VYPSVAPAFAKTTATLEGVCRWPYVDVKGLVTTAAGYLVDDGSGQAPPNMLRLPWKHVDGTPATYDEIRAAWLKVKHSGLAGVGGGSAKFENLTDLRLDDAGLQVAFDGWVTQAEPELRKTFPGYDTMPADAQLALLLMAYALGPAFGPRSADPGKRYPKFVAAMNAVVPNFVEAAAQSNISTVGNPGVLPRDEDIQILLANAARAQHANVPYSVLWWPGTTPPSGAALARYPVKRTVPWGRVAGGAILGTLAVGIGWAGVAGYQAHRRGEPWTKPAVDLERRVERRVVDAEGALGYRARRLLRE
jgi:hypothetical protein